MSFDAPTETPSDKKAMSAPGIANSLSEVSPSLKEELAALADRASDLLGTPTDGRPSRLAATVVALKSLVSVLESAEGAATPIPPLEVVRVATDLGDWGFTLDELIEALNPAGMILYPRRYKNSLSDMLRDAGFIRRQVRREGARPLVWFSPGQ